MAPLTLGGPIFPKRTIDIPSFIFANVAVDIEPLIVINFGLKYPLHGYAHTLGGALIIGSDLGMIIKDGGIRP